MQTISELRARINKAEAAFDNALAQFNRVAGIAEALHADPGDYLEPDPPGPEVTFTHHPYGAAKRIERGFQVDEKEVRGLTYYQVVPENPDLEMRWLVHWDVTFVWANDDPAGYSARDIAEMRVDWSER